MSTEIFAGMVVIALFIVALPFLIIWAHLSTQTKLLRKIHEALRYGIEQRKFKAILFLLLSGAVCLSGMAESGQAMTKRYEGWRSRSYKCTENHWTIGYGFNVSDPIVEKLLPPDIRIRTRGLSKEEGNKIFNARYQIARRHARAYVTNVVYDKLTSTRQNVLTDMAYNLGPTRLAGFKKLKKALIAKNYIAAAKEMKDSAWYGQVGRRAKELIWMMEKGA